MGSIRPESELARLVGATIAGKYKVEKVIGSGAMGVVCSARHVEIGKRVAIKLIESSIAGNADVARRFRREARAASIVESDHIVQVFDVGEDPHLGLYMVMEYLTGEDLSARLARETMLDVDTSVKIAYQVSRALSKAHAAGVIHRDLKPANVFLVAKEDKSIFVKVLDFGISKMLGSESLAKSGQRERQNARSIFRPVDAVASRTCDDVNQSPRSLIELVISRERLNCRIVDRHFIRGNHNLRAVVLLLQFAGVARWNPQRRGFEEFLQLFDSPARVQPFRNIALFR